MANKKSIGGGNQWIASQLAAQREQLNKKEEKNKELLKNLYAEISKLNKESENLMIEANFLKGVVQSNKREKEELKDAINERIKESENQVSELQAENKCLKEMNSSLSSTLDFAQREVHVLKNQLKESEHQNEVINKKFQESSISDQLRLNQLKELQSREAAFQKKIVFAEMLFRALYNTEGETTYNSILPFVCELSDRFNAIDITKEA